jgi:hypothetical protein
VILDAGFLIAIDRSEKTAHMFVAAAIRTGTALHTTHPVVAQVWRDGPRQARLTAFLNVIAVHAFDDGRTVGRLLARSTTSDVVDADLVIRAVRIGHDILTGDPHGIAPLTALFGPAAPAVHTWP